MRVGLSILAKPAGMDHVPWGGIYGPAQAMSRPIQALMLSYAVSQG